MKLNNLAWKKLLDRSHQVLKADQLPSWISLLKAFSIEAFDTGREACCSATLWEHSFYLLLPVGISLVSVCLSCILSFHSTCCLLKPFSGSWKEKVLPLPFSSLICINPSKFQLLLLCLVVQAHCTVFRLWVFSQSGDSLN